MQTEIEIKAKINSIPEIRKRIGELGAKKKSKKRMVDIYYTPEKGEKYYGKGSRLKFRIRYDGVSNKGRLEVHKVTGLLDAIEYEQPIADVKMMKQMLKELRYKQCALVDKVRESYKYKKMNIELDKVKGLGEFMEIEIMNANKSKAIKEIKSFYKKIGILEKDFVMGNGYGDMMAKHNKK